MEFLVFIFYFSKFQFMMYNEGEIIRISDMEDPYSGRISQLFWKVKGLMNRSTMTPQTILLEDRVVLSTSLKVFVMQEFCLLHILFYSLLVKLDWKIKLLNLFVLGES